MEEQCKIEVVELHQFFQDWFNGKLEATAENFTRLTQVVSDKFVIIGPNGKLIEREPLLDRLRESHGARDRWEIWIENFQLHRLEGNLAIITYEEWQKGSDGTTTSRVSTAIFAQKSGTPNGVEWLHVHETWLAG